MAQHPPLNVKVLRLTPHVALASGAAPLASAPATAHATMSAWSANEVFNFLKAADVEGPARILFSNGVRGKDFVELDVCLFISFVPCHVHVYGRTSCWGIRQRTKKEFVELTVDVLVADLRLSQLAARNVLAAREDFLANAVAQ